MTTFEVKQNDSNLPLSAEADISGATIKASIRTKGAEAEVPSTVPVVVTDAATGDFDVIVSGVGSGDFDLEVLVTKGAEEIHIPRRGFHRLVISPNLDDPLAQPYVPSATLEQVIEEKFAEVIPFAEAAEAAASEAGSFAAATEFDANRAGESAFQSGQSASTALGHRNAAQEAAGIAQASAASITRDVPGGVPTLDGDSRLPDTRLPDRLSSAALGVTIATTAPATSAFSPLLQKIAAGTNDVNLLIVGDSTTAKTGSVDQTGVQVDTWGERLPAALAAQFPTHTISTRWYNDGTAAYDTAEVITGTGPRTINVWMGAVPGKETGYPLVRFASLLVTPAAAGVDLLVIAHGHNENNVATGGNTGTDAKLRDRYISNVEQMRTYIGNPPTVLTSQNPAPVIPGFSERRADIYRAYAAERGYGFVDVCAAFYADGRSISGVLVQTDGLHPSNAGAVVWLAAFMERMRVSNATAQALRPAPPAFFEQRRNFLTTPNFDNWPTGSSISGWNATNVTLSQQTGNAALLESKSYSAKLAKTAGGASAKLDQTVTAQAKLLAGREVTFAVRMFIPAGTPQTAAQLSMSDGATLLASDQTKPVNDIWFWKIVSLRCRPTMTALTMNIQVDPNATGNLETIYVDRASLVLGRYPGEAF